MVITEVRIKLMEDNSENERLLALCSVTFDDAFVVRDLKIIEGTKGSFVAMPSRKLTDRCQSCGCENHLRARYCNQCGAKLDENRATRDADGRANLLADIAHPINSACREVIQTAVLLVYQAEKERSKQPGDVCTYEDYDSGYDHDKVVDGFLEQEDFQGLDAHVHRCKRCQREFKIENDSDDNRAVGFGDDIL